MTVARTASPFADPTEVRDVGGYVYPLAARIGQGAQGVVYGAVNGWLAVKLVRAGRGTVADALRERIAAVRRLPIEELPIARPVATLAPPHVGYVMRLMTGMTPIKQLMRPVQRDLPLSTWYLESGGLRRRLVLLEHFARTLAGLHALGLTYGDPSPNNLLISADPSRTEVQFIDADNLRFHDRAAGPGIFTPQYGAPELVRGEATNTSAADMWAFLSIAFQVLVLGHPMIGQVVDEGDPELEDSAMRGELPWIDDASDDRNRADPRGAMPRAVVLSPALQHLFESCFGAGRTNPSARPTAARAAVAFGRAARMTIQCTTCTASFYVTADNCPWCGARRAATVLAALHRWEGDGEAPLQGGLGSPEVIVLEDGRRHVVDSSMVGVSPDDPALGFRLELQSAERGVCVRTLDGRRHEVRSPDGLTARPLPPEGCELPTPTARMSSWRIHMGPLTQPHTYCTLHLLEGGHAAR